MVKRVSEVIREVYNWSGEVEPTTKGPKSRSNANREANGDGQQKGWRGD